MDLYRDGKKRTLSVHRLILRAQVVGWAGLAVSLAGEGIRHLLGD